MIRRRHEATNRQVFETFLRPFVLSVTFCSHPKDTEQKVTEST